VVVGGDEPIEELGQGGDLPVVVLAVESVEQPLLLPVGEPLEPFQQDHSRPPQQVDLPAPAALGLADGPPADLVNSPGEQPEDVELVDDQHGVGQQVADGLGGGGERVDGYLLDPGQPLVALGGQGLEQHRRCGPRRWR